MISVRLSNLIAYYIERQRLVMLAMLDLNPRSLVNPQGKIARIDLQPYLENFLHKEGQTQNPMTLRSGIWKSDWKYKVHGIGCRLVHINTDEPLEWDAPDSNLFRFDWFWEHLLWRCSHEKSDPNISSIQDWLSKASETDVESLLIEQGIINIRQDGLISLNTT